MTSRTRITVFSAQALSGDASEDSLEEDRGHALVRASVHHHSRKASSNPNTGTSNDATATGLLSEEELIAVEQEYPNGIPAVQIVETFASRGVRFSEATFRKYVQQGLLPRSRRVGRKGKHRGSLGVYPCKVVRRINVIKSLMLDGYTIEEIQNQFLQFTDAVESIEEGVHEALELFSAEVQSEGRFDSKARKNFERDIKDAEKCADELLSKIQDLSHRLSQSHDSSYGGNSAAGSAEDLL